MVIRAGLIGQAMTVCPTFSCWLTFSLEREYSLAGSVALRPSTVEAEVGLGFKGPCESVKLLHAPPTCRNRVNHRQIKERDWGYKEKEKQLKVHLRILNPRRADIAM